MRRLTIGLVILLLTTAIGLTAVWLLVFPSQATDESDLAVPPVNTPPWHVEMEEPPGSREIDDQEERPTELFTDFKRIGRPRHNKVEIRCFDRGSERFAEIKFYSRNRGGAWLQKQSFEFTKNDHLDCDPRIEDFNNDGLGDFTYQSAVAARGANEIRKLFIYDRKGDKLVYIQNSEDYPNLAYNKKLDCVDAWLVYGATTTVFLRIDGEMLKEFASVETGTERVVTVTNRLGKRRVLYWKKMKPTFENIYWRFSTYDPPR